MVFTVMRKGCSLVRRIELTRLPLSLSVTFFFTSPLYSSCQIQVRFSNHENKTDPFTYLFPKI